MRAKAAQRFSDHLVLPMLMLTAAVTPRLKLRHGRQAVIGNQATSSLSGNTSAATQCRI